jgi:GNAT superfamily N-acetyltransferase
VSGRSESTIRVAKPSDAEAIAPLLGQLGYPADTEEVRERLGRLLGRPDAGVLVAERPADPVAERPNDIVAVASYQISDLLERSRPQCRITALVVRDDRRRLGAAGALVRAIESVARERGCFRLEVTTSSHRPEAMAFYTAAGFAERPRRLVKPLAPERGG